MARKRPMTAEELFNRINGILKEKGKLPDILDYGLWAYRPVQVETYESDLKSSPVYGAAMGEQRPGLALRGPKRRPIWICGCLSA